MFPKLNRWTILFLPILLLAAWTIWPLNVSAAQVAAPPPTNSCLTCHEDLYYLHDTGKWYCITEHKDHCVDCHEGNASVMDKKDSHQGLVAHPQQNNGEKCQECHPGDSQARLTTFASLGGYKTITDTRLYAIHEAEAGAFPIVSETTLAEKWPWLMGGVVAFGFWLTLVLFSPMKP